MKKLNSVVYGKLLLQAEEAKDQGMEKLAGNILGAIGPHPEEDTEKYSFGSLEDDVEAGLWKLAMCVLKYHGSESASAEKVEAALQSIAEKFISDIELALGDDGLGPNEEKVLGEE